MKKAYILILDDENEGLTWMKTMVKNNLVNSKNYTIKGFSNGNALLSFLEKKKDLVKIPLVISDFRLDDFSRESKPKNNGIDVLNQVKTLLPNTKRVLYSGYAERQHLERAFNNDIIDAFFDLMSLRLNESFFRILYNLITQWESRYISASNSCFMIMPFNSKFDRLYLRIFKPAVEGLGVSCIRQDESYPINKLIINDIFEHITNAQFILADITDNNANVFYELGFAHALGKPIVIFSQSISNCPFDLKGFHIHEYSSKIRSYKKIQQKISKSIEQHKKGYTQKITWRKAN